MIFDTHCHYNLEPIYSGKAEFFKPELVESIKTLNWQDHWQQAKQEGIKASLVAGADLTSSQRAIQIASQESNLFASVGINPADFTNQTLEQLLADFKIITDLANDKNVIAIGEVGLGYFRLKELTIDQQYLQHQVFTAHIKLANKLSKPLIIHARDKTDRAYTQILELLKDHYQFNKPFVLHCVSGPISYIQEALKLGAYISFAGNITYPNANELREILKITPADKLLIETDAPFLPPQTKRGQVNQPQNISLTAAYLEQEHGVNLSQVYQNSCNFFEVTPLN